MNSTKKKLLDAINQNDLPMVINLLDNGAHFKMYDNLAIKNCTSKGHLEILKYLHSKGEDIHLNNDFLLMTAINHGHLPIVKYLLENEAIFNGKYIDFEACLEKGHVQIIEYLFEQNIIFDENNKVELISLACKLGYLELIEQIIKVTPNFTFHIDDVKNVCKNGHLDILKLAISLQPTIPLNSYIPLMEAVDNAQLPLINYLIDKGADVNCGGFNYLVKSIANNFKKSANMDQVMEALIDAGLNVNAISGLLLTRKIHENNLDVIYYLIDKGADISSEHSTAVRSAVEMNNKKILTYLLSLNANIRGENDSALYMAAALNNEEIVGLLMDKGAKLNKDFNQGEIKNRHNKNLILQISPEMYSFINTKELSFKLNKELSHKTEAEKRKLKI